MIHFYWPYLLGGWSYWGRAHTGRHTGGKVCSFHWLEEQKSPWCGWQNNGSGWGNSGACRSTAAGILVYCCYRLRCLPAWRALSHSTLLSSSLDHLDFKGTWVKLHVWRGQGVLSWLSVLSNVAWSQWAVTAGRCLRPTFRVKPSEMSPNLYFKGNKNILQMIWKINTQDHRCHLS